MKIENAITNIPILQDASDEIKNKIYDNGKLIVYKKGEKIFREREEVNELFFIVSGYIVLYRHNYGGDRKNVFVYGAGTFSNEVIIQDNIASISAEAMCETVMLSIPRKLFLSFLNDTDFAKAVIESEASKIRKLYRQMANTPNGFKLEKQIASKLWKLGKDFGIETEKGVKIAFPLSVTFLADMVGGKRESVSRILNKWKEREILETSKTNFFIKDMDELLFILKN